MIQSIKQFDGLPVSLHAHNLAMSETITSRDGVTSSSWNGMGDLGTWRQSLIASSSAFFIHESAGLILEVYADGDSANLVGRDVLDKSRVVSAAVGFMIGRLI